VSEIRFIDLFSGIGGFRRGLELIGGYRCVWSCDNNKYANQVYTKHFGKENHYSGDIRKVKASSIPNHDLLCAGFPCQAFSVAGKRQGFRDTRGTLFFEIARIARAKRSALLLLENVKGLLNHDEGLTFQVILESLEELGYLVEWQVLNSKHFGVPQNRERVFIIGHSRNGSTRPVFPITEPNPVSIEEPGGREGIASCLDSNYHKGASRQRTFVVDPFNKAERQDMMAGTVKTNQGSNTSTGMAIAILTPDRLEKRQHGRRFKDQGEPMFTLTGQDKHGVLIHDAYSHVEGKPRIYKDTAPTTPTPAGGGHLPYVANCVDQDGYLRRGERDRDENGNPVITSIANRRIRRLTPVECERLQGFPDGWTEGISDTQRYKCLGNAVTVNVIRFLGELIHDSWC